MLANITGINKVFDVAEQAVGVVGHLRNMNSARKDAQKAAAAYRNKDENSTSDSSDSSTSSPANYLKHKDLQPMLDAIEKRVHKNIDRVFKDKLGSEASLTLEFIGFYSAHYEFRFNPVEKKMYLDIFDESGAITSFADTAQVTFGHDYGIAVRLEVKANMIAEQKWSKLNDYTPDFLNLNDTRVNATVEGEIAGSIVFERTFTYKNNDLPASTDTLIFTGIKGKLLMKVKVEVKKDRAWTKKNEIDISKEDKKGKPEGIDFDLIPGFTINFDEQPVFDENMVKTLMK